MLRQTTIRSVTGVWSYTIPQWITLLLISTSCVRKICTSDLQMARSDAAEPFIICWSWMDRRWVQVPREAAADSRPDSGTGSQLFEINMWMWRYGRTFPHQISVDQVVEFRKKKVQESRARGAETLRRRRDAAWAKGASSPQ